ncbi:aminotransferase class I/II-fold pyridoxal phosphate-dependent enzyme [Carnobacterium sp. CS13]|uniref:MalY/PatB family protein n=1 Tax=Carnobacterium sp. CS13 TaxID=2800128 RepID=UPI001911A828|nr:aminotransferase class I/II-fold pyridoxal phosphate-dependent enzyme [Carnobacterium sp. CS13]QQP70055.1 aminotransferase class I/II-fold pyridoxal phosphate-dependent enzyme [Carnobacterium sp. CS13]
MNEFNSLLDRRGNGSKKWDTNYIEKRFKTRREDIYPLFIADTDFKPDKKVQEKFIEVIKKGDFGYFDISDAFFNSIVNWYQSKLMTSIDKSWIIPANGTIASLHLAAHAVADDKPILIFTPVYGVFKDIASNFGEMVTFPLKLEENEYTIDFALLEVTIKEKQIKTILFCNPHNPSGKIWSNEELTKLVYLCKSYGIVLLSDEIHGEINVSDKPFSSLIHYMEDYSKIIVSSSPNKSFNLSGINASYLIIKNEALRAVTNTELKKFHITINRIGMEFITIVYKYGNDWHDRMIQQIKINIQLVKTLLKSSQIQFEEPDSGYLIWMKLNKIENIDSFVIELAKETGVLIETGSRFIENYENYVRINVATSPILLEEAINKFKLFYDQY